MTCSDHQAERAPRHYTPVHLHLHHVLAGVVFARAEVHDALAETDSNAWRRQYLRMDKAWLLRNAGAMDASVELLEAVLADAAPEQIDEVSRIHCLAVLERDLLAGVVQPHEVTDLSGYCTAGGTRSMMMAGGVQEDVRHAIADATSLWPNPTTGLVNVRGFAGRPNRLEVLDIAGRQVASLVFTDRTEADLQLAPGVYTYRIMDLSRVSTGMAQGHLVIAR